MLRDGPILLDRGTDAKVPAGRVRARKSSPRSRRQTTAALVVLAVLLSVVGGLLQPALQRAVAAVVADKPMVHSEDAALADLWRVYKDVYLQPGTRRTTDRPNGDTTTSEGESYTMLRAVWMDDQQTFAQNWQWTKDNLQQADHRLAWRFGKRPDGSYGVQTRTGGNNSATDADVDTAFALLMAYSRWKQDVYLYDALPLIASIWAKSVVLVDGRPVLTSDDVQRANPLKVLVNPSYFAPYAYRVFAKVDRHHRWQALVDNGYALLAQLDRQPLDAHTAAGLPPDWVYLNRSTARFSAAGGRLTTDFGYDALRLPWRLALDYSWYGDQRARQLLQRESLLTQAWTRDHRLAAGYSRDGKPSADYESPAMYGGAMGYFTVVRPDLAGEVYARELLSLYDPNTEGLSRPLSYYDSNWVWFGMALHLHRLSNLTVTQG
jgi:endoglucanase